MGTRGPVPKPAATRRRTNKPEIPVKKAPSGKPAGSKPAKKVSRASAKPTARKRPEPWLHEHASRPSSKWHPVAKSWYLSLFDSGQSEFYEPSDWATAYLVAESISRDLGLQVVGVSLKGEILRDTIPMKGASLSAYMKAFTDLCVTEGSRRRMSIELTKGDQRDPDADRANATVTDIAVRLSASAG